MKKYLIIFLSLAILLLTGCAGENTEAEPVVMQTCVLDRLNISLPDYFMAAFEYDDVVAYSNDSDNSNSVMILVYDNATLDQLDLNNLLEGLEAESYELEWAKDTAVNGYSAKKFRYHATFEGAVSYTVSYWIQFENQVYDIAFFSGDKDFWNKTYDACVESIAFS